MTLVFVGLLLWKTDLSEVTGALARTNYLLIAPAFATTVLSYLLRTLRWGRILRPIRILGFRALLPVLFIGFMAVAAFHVHWKIGYFWTGRGLEMPLLLLILALVILIRGGGEYSVDRRIGREV